MKKPLLKMLLLSLTVGGMCLTSCKQDPKPEDTKEVAEDQNEAKFDDTNEAKEDDSEYLIAAAEKDLAEIETGKLAVSKGTDADVKKLGQMMIDEHTKASAMTKSLAAKKNVSLPTSITDKGKEHFEDLNDEKTGNDFDKKYADMMVDGHEDTISKLKDASEKANDPEIRAWAAGMIPTLETHLTHAKTVQEKLKSKK